MQGIDYSRIAAEVRGVGPAAFAGYVGETLGPQLGALWGDRYARDSGGADLVVVELDTFAYLFDLRRERNVAAYGVMTGKNSAARPNARMRGYPKAEGPQYHRGHMIPHTGHGGTDINLFIQLGAVNTGHDFRGREDRAVAAPGAFYFVNLLYAPGWDGQRPLALEQGLATPTLSFDAQLFPN